MPGMKPTPRVKTPKVKPIRGMKPDKPKKPKAPKKSEGQLIDYLGSWRKINFPKG